eukprot:1190443-Prorocentrum_minimum.AAC.1
MNSSIEPLALSSANPTFRHFNSAVRPEGCAASQQERGTIGPIVPTVLRPPFGSRASSRCQPVGQSSRSGEESRTYPDLPTRTECNGGDASHQEGELNSPVAEWLKKGSTSVSSPDPEQSVEP